MLLDLGTVAAADASALPTGVSFPCWGSSALDSRRCFTKMSDMHLIGALPAEVFSISGISRSAAAYAFINKVQRKRLSADAALNDPWLAQY